ncbi:hypothetical protein HDU83_000060 [Entophlyctis luteolus]|nr:hypothetical protein HDU83_000060 [Entophlyctis luteolus]
MSATVFVLVRHAEKLHWPAGLPPDETARAAFVDSHLASVAALSALSPKGIERANALAAYFIHRPEMTALYESAPLAAIVCQAYNTAPRGAGKSWRPAHTIYPLYAALQLGESTALNSHGDRHPSAKAAEEFRRSSKVEFCEFIKAEFDSMVETLTSGKYAGKTIIVCWSHQTLPELAVRLGVSEELVPRKWGKRYDVTWVITRRTANEPTEFHQLPQLLLWGDDASVIQVKKVKHAQAPISDRATRRREYDGDGDEDDSCDD